MLKNQRRVLGSDGLLVQRTGRLVGDVVAAADGTAVLANANGLLLVLKNFFLFFLII